MQIVHKFKIIINRLVVRFLVNVVKIETFYQENESGQ